MSNITRAQITAAAAALHADGISNLSVANIRHMLESASLVPLENQRAEAVAKCLRNILPMAKAYARSNSVGNNRMMVAEAQSALSAYIDECSWSDLRDSGGIHGAP